MASQKQILANRQNATRATGPKSVCGKQVTRFNRLKHGLRAEQVVLPGESAAKFEAERAAWFDDWKPGSQTRAVLIERAAAASWRLRRSVRVESARLRKLANAAAAGFDAEKRCLVEAAMARLGTNPASALAMLRSDPAGLDHLIGLWSGLAETAAAPMTWVFIDTHHDRLLGLLGYPADTNTNEMEDDIGRVSFNLMNANNPAAEHDEDGPLDADGKEEAAAMIGEVCDEQLEALRALRGRHWETSVLRGRAIDAACIDTSKEAVLHHRYEMAHDRSLRATINQLVALHKSGADIVEDDEEDEVVVQVPVTPSVASPAPVAPTEPNPPVAAAPTEPNSKDPEGPIAPTEPNFAAEATVSGRSKGVPGGRTWAVTAAVGPAPSA